MYVFRVCSRVCSSLSTEPAISCVFQVRSRVCWCPPSEPALSFFGHAHRKDHPFQRTSKDEHHHKGHHKADAEGAAKAGSPAQAGAENNRRMSMHAAD
eukprot:scaffold42617_cov19-Tisochrysis_lutea.AAC.1